MADGQKRIDRIVKWLRKVLGYMLLACSIMAFALYMRYRPLSLSQKTHLWNFVLRVFDVSLAALSQTRLSFVLTLVSAFVAAFLLFFLFRVFRSEGDWVSQAKDSLLAGIVGLTVPLLIMGSTFAWKSVTVIYDDHQTLAATVNSLRNAPQPICPSPAPCPASAVNLEKRNIQSKLSLLMKEGNAIRDDWKTAMGKPGESQLPHANKARQWHTALEDYLRKIPRGDIYTVRLNSAPRTGFGGYPMGHDPKVNDVWDSLISDLSVLDQFIKDPELGEP